MLHTRMKQRTEPSLSLDPSQSLKLFKRLKLDKQERTAREDQRNKLSAKLTMPKVVLDLVTNALLLQYAHQTSNQEVEVVAEAQVVELDLLTESKTL